MVDRTARAARKATWGMGAGLAFAGIVFACSSTPGPLYPAVSDFCQAYAQQTCQEATNCATSTSTCVTEQSALCEQNANAAISDGYRVYVPNNAPAAVTQAQLTYATDNVSFTDETLLVAAFANVFVGSQGLGSQCSNAYDCAGASTGVICDTVCVQQSAPIPAGPTGFCSEPGQVCATGAYCNTVANPQVCTVDPPLNAPCSATVPCGPSARCIGSPQGICEPRALAGAGKGSCATNDDCDPTAPICDQFDGYICTAQLIFSPAETALCQNYGGGTTLFDAGPPPVIIVDSGPSTLDSATTPDSGNTATDASGD